MPTSEKRRKLLVLKGYRFFLSNLLILTCYQKTRGRALVYMRSHPVNNVGEHKGEKCRPIMKPLCYIVILCALCRDIGHPTVPSIKFNFRFPNLHGSAQFTLLQWNSNTRVYARRPGHFHSHLDITYFLLASPGKASYQETTVATWSASPVSFDSKKSRKKQAKQW